MISNFYKIFLTGTLMAISLTSCGPRVPKADDAFDLVKKERMLLKDSGFVSDEIIRESMKTVIVKKNETPDEWTPFKTETDRKIRLNEKKIKELEGFHNASGSLHRKVASLKKDNNDLRKRMNEYQEEAKVKLEMFKASMSHNVKIIDNELSSLKAGARK